MEYNLFKYGQIWSSEKCQNFLIRKDFAWLNPAVILLYGSNSKETRSVHKADGG